MSSSPAAAWRATGLGEGWRCLFANDFDARKAQTYAANFGDDDLKVGDIWDLTAADLPGRADLAWASSPCQDLSLAGARKGLSGGRSSAFWGFWALIEALDREGRAPRTIAIENVTGLLTSPWRRGLPRPCAPRSPRGDICSARRRSTRRCSRPSRVPRLFVLAVREPPPPELLGDAPDFHTAAVRKAHAALPPELKESWLWWRLSAPARRNTRLADVLDDKPCGWLSPARTERLVLQLAPLHRARLDEALASGERRVGAVFRRMRVEDGRKVQRAEVRFDGLAGCLRTPTGGSSRQFLLVVEDGAVRARLLTGREAARLMGLPEDYRLPAGGDPRPAPGRRRGGLSGGAPHRRPAHRAASDSSRPYPCGGVGKRARPAYRRGLRADSEETPDDGPPMTPNASAARAAARSTTPSSTPSATPRWCACRT